MTDNYEQQLSDSTLTAVDCLSLVMGLPTPAFDRLAQAVRTRENDEEAEARGL